MAKRDERRQELLEELARRFHNSADTLRAIARRIEDAGRATLAARALRGEATGALCADLGAPPETVPFSYREYLEFTSAEEFRRFTDASVVTDADLQAVDWSQLLRRLLQPLDEQPSA